MSSICYCWDGLWHRNVIAIEWQSMALIDQRNRTTIGDKARARLSIGERGGNGQKSVGRKINEAANEKT